jgi:hypothetical protein
MLAILRIEAPSLPACYVLAALYTVDGPPVGHWPLTPIDWMARETASRQPLRPLDGRGFSQSLPLRPWKRARQLVRAASTLAGFAHVL